MGGRRYYFGGELVSATKLQNYSKSSRQSTILVTHDPTEAMALADESLLVEAGRLLQTVPIEEVISSTRQ